VTEAQAIGVTKGGRNSKIHAVVDEECRPWAFVLTPGNTADCTVAETCASLIPGIAGLVADKGYDTEAFRAWLKQYPIKTVIPEDPTARSAFDTTGNLTRVATWSSAALSFQGMASHRHPLRRVRTELLLRPMLRSYAGLLALI